ncbi:MAG: ribonuclease D [Candidatus Melainabacteria bacterium]|nr:ribonuclease D [Candidatus Melainabacteria bacterium]
MSTHTLVKQKPEVFDFDIPDERLNHYLKKSVVSVDTETRGLILRRDRLCLVQICDEDGLVTFVRFRDRNKLPYHGDSNLKKLFTAPQVMKLFHYARFDVSVMKYYLGIDINPIWCTKIASKLVRTYTDKHSLKYLVSELLEFELDKSDQTSDWAKDDLTDSQLDYAANDVRVLIPLQNQLHALLEREGRMSIAQRLFDTLPLVCELDQLGFHNIFEH